MDKIAQKTPPRRFPTPRTPVRPSPTTTTSLVHGVAQSPAALASALLAGYSPDIHTATPTRSSPASTGGSTAIEGKEQSLLTRCEVLKRKASALGDHKYSSVPSDLEVLIAYGKAKVALMDSQLELFEFQVNSSKMAYREGIITAKTHDGEKERLAKAMHITRRERFYCKQAVDKEFTNSSVLELMDELRRVGEAYVLAVTTQHKGIDKTPEWLKRSPDYQRAFRRDLEVLYGGMPSGVDQLWCPVMHRFFDPEAVVAAHLVPHLIGYDQAGYIFNDVGHGFKHIWSRRNGLLLFRPIEKAFNQARCVIIPSRTNLNDGEFELHLLDQSLADVTLRTFSDASGQVIVVKWSDIDGRQLDFRNAKTRPRRRYLYSHYILALMRIVRNDLPNWAASIDKILTMFPKPFASPGKYWGDSTLCTMARIITGDADDADMFKTPDHPEMWELDEQVAEDIATEAIMHSELAVEEKKQGWASSQQDDEIDYEMDVSEFLD